MRIGRSFSLCLIFLLLTSMVFAEQILTPEDKAYLDGLNQKTVAQISGKIDAQSNAVEKNLRDQVALAKDEMKYEITQEMKGALKGIAVGLGGIILVVLSIFRIIDIKFQHTNKIKKYEKELELKLKNMEELAKQSQIQFEDNELLKKELGVYKQSLDRYAVSLGIQPQINSEKQQETFEKQKKEKTPFFSKRNIVRLILVLVVLSIIFYFVGKNYLRLF